MGEEVSRSDTHTNIQSPVYDKARRARVATGGLLKKGHRSAP